MFDIIIFIILKKKGIISMLNSKKRLLYLSLSFFFPIFTFSIFIFFNIKSNNLFYGDLQAQYLPIFRYLYNILHGNATFPYTFSKGLGGSMYGAIFYGFSNPINFFVYFFNDVKIFIIISMLFKIGLSGLTSFLLLKYKGNNDKISFIFSLAYSLSGYMCLYFIHIIWLDSIWLLPLIIIGIDKIINKEKDYIYILSLFFVLVCNYYIGYIICLFSILYYFYQLYLNNGKKFIKNNLKNIMHFIFITFIVGCSVMFILIPIYFESLNFNRFFVKKNIFNFIFSDYFAGTYLGFDNIKNVLNEKTFLSYCGILSFILNIFYFFSKKITKKEKKATFILYFILLIPIVFTPFIKFWHLFTFPVCYAYRYSFIFILIKIINSAKILEIEEDYNKNLLLIFVIYLIVSVSFFVLIFDDKKYYNIGLLNIILTLLLMVLYLFLLYKKHFKIIIYLFIIELLLNFSIIGYDICNDRTLYFNRIDYSDYQKLGDTISRYNNYNYRVELTDSDNLSLNNNYYGLSTFLSNQNYYNILFCNYINNILLPKNYYLYSNTNVFFDNLVGLKYIIDYRKNYNYDIIEENKYEGYTFYLHKNPYSLGLGYSVSNRAKKINLNESDKKFDFYNKLYNYLDDSDENYFIKLDVEKIDSKSFRLNKNKNYGQLFVKTNLIPNNYDEDDIIIYENYFIFYDVIEDNISFEFNSDIDELEIYSIDMDKIKKFVDNREKLIIEENDGNYLRGNINLSNDSILLLTIPYEKGWTIFVDGKKVSYYKILDSLIGIDLSKGYHELEMRYEVPGLKTGIFVSLFSLIILFVYERIKFG